MTMIFSLSRALLGCLSLVLLCVGCATTTKCPNASSAIIQAINLNEVSAHAMINLLGEMDESSYIESDEIGRLERTFSYNAFRVRAATAQSDMRYLMRKNGVLTTPLGEGVFSVSLNLKIVDQDRGNEYESMGYDKFVIGRDSFSPWVAGDASSFMNYLKANGISYRRLNEVLLVEQNRLRK